MQNLVHPNIINFIGVSTEFTSVCIITEFMSKGSL